MREIGGNGSRGAAKGLVQLGKDAQEPISFERETLADLVRNVSDSYNPKRKKEFRSESPRYCQGK